MQSICLKCNQTNRLIMKLLACYLLLIALAIKPISSLDFTDSLSLTKWIPLREFKSLASAQQTTTDNSLKLSSSLSAKILPQIGGLIRNPAEAQQVKPPNEAQQSIIARPQTRSPDHLAESGQFRGSNEGSDLIGDSSSMSRLMNVNCKHSQSSRQNGSNEGIGISSESSMQPEMVVSASENEESKLERSQIMEEDRLRKGRRNFGDKLVNKSERIIDDDDEGNDYYFDNDDADDNRIRENLIGTYLDAAPVRKGADFMQGNESVALEQSVASPEEDARFRQRRRSSSRGRSGELQSQGESEAYGSSPGESNELNAEPNSNSSPNLSQEESEDSPDSSSNEMSEQEAAGAKEAEEADRSALDEQQQQQREIILAQAQSEAKAIKEQQEALMRQQSLQQQMILKRQQDLNIVNLMDDPRRANSQIANPLIGGHVSGGGGNDAPAGTGEAEGRSRRRSSSSQRTRAESANVAANGRKVQMLDTQFSDQPSADESGHNFRSSGGKNGQSAKAFDNFDDDEEEEEEPVKEQAPARQAPARRGGDNLSDPNESADYSIQRAVYELPTGQKLTPIDQRLEQVTENKLETISASKLSQLGSGSDLLPAAQHHYGSHYGSLHGHNKEYYQYAESHKKGQFDSGFKRGGKKMTISGHSSQHKSHAEGHVKWHSKKGKGTHYWDYKHKNHKKHHGGHHYH